LWANRCGGLLVMAIGRHLHFMSDIIRRIDTETTGCEGYSLDQEKRLSCARQTVMHFLCGENSSTSEENRASTVQSFAMNRHIEAANSFDKRMQLLIASGLVRGITPTSIRTQLGVQIPAFVSSYQAGDDAGARSDAS
jgi:hypothetical protein